MNTKGKQKVNHGIRKSSEDDDACSRLWSVYIEEAERYDMDLLEGWKNDMDGMLLFSALYSASLTSFLIESYKTLQDDPAESTVQVLTYISQQLTSVSNGTVLPPVTLPSSSPAVSSIICNVLWFLSLFLALACSLLATFVKQWTRDFIHKTSIHPAPARRARVFAFAYFGLKNLGMHAFVDIIPILLHTSLVFFFAGLVAFLFPVNGLLTFVMAGLLGVFLLVYIGLTCVPLIRLDAPYRTPFSSTTWRILNRLLSGLLLRKHKLQFAHEHLTLIEATMERSLVDSVDRDSKAMRYTMKSINDDTELLPLIEAIPDVVYGPDGVRTANKYLILELLDTAASGSNVISRITSLLEKSGAWTEPVFRARAIMACPKALWALALMLLHISEGSGHPEADDFQPLWFGIRLPELMSNLRLLQQDLAVSARAAMLLVHLCNFQRYINVIAEVLNRPNGVPSEQIETVSRILEKCDEFRGTPPHSTNPIFTNALNDLVSIFRSRTIHWQDADASLQRARQAMSALQEPSHWWAARLFILSDFLKRAIPQRMLPHEFSLMVNTICSGNRPNTFIPRLRDPAEYSWAQRPFHEMWVLVRNTFCDDITDKLFIASLTFLGDYIVSQDLAPLPAGERVAPSYVRIYIERRSMDQAEGSGSNAGDAMRWLWDEDHGGHIGNCILSEMRNGPYLYLEAPWKLCTLLFFQYFRPSSRERFEKWMKSLSLLLRETPTQNRRDRLFPFVELFADWFLFETAANREEIEEYEDLENFGITDLENLKMLGQELAPSLSMPDIHREQDFSAYLQSVEFSAMTRYVEICTTSPRPPSSITVFGSFLPAGPLRSYETKIYTECQVQFAQRTSLLLEELIAGKSELEWLFTAICEMTDDWNSSWLTDGKAAEIISEALKRYKISMGGLKYEAAILLTWCEEVIQSNRATLPDASGDRHNEDAATTNT